MDVTTYTAVMVLAFISGMTTLIGVLLASCCKRNIRLVAGGIGFSAGIMLTISLFELIPESISSAGLTRTLLSAFLGILLLALLNYIIPHTHLIHEKGKARKGLIKAAYLTVIGLVLHDFPEGFAMANSYIYAPMLGVLVAIAIALHNIPEEFAMAMPLVVIKKKAFLYKAAFISGLAEPVGAIIGLAAVSILPALNPLFMSFAAGAMIFVSLHELVPMANRYRKPMFFLFGAGLGVLTYLGLTSFLGV